jgi:hypothetical protein
MTTEDSGVPRGFDGHRRAQARRGLSLTPAERLRWLEETMETLRRWQGRARKTAREDPPSPQRGSSSTNPR